MVPDSPSPPAADDDHDTCFACAFCCGLAFASLVESFFAGRWFWVVFWLVAVMLNGYYWWKYERKARE